ncbi:hypothetical protein KP509_20G042600 [Ceratopteris richardii]|uniref:NADH-ubiquinone reductase complex 1 MLRQ subunit n=1 Tax=Ceratopteris richardii TaxID=49495 RepID=A0A8T2SIA2_CERRI|nr:hypothetical protein KP509_20G042600 [Ceratopteris richardii]
MAGGYRWVRPEIYPLFAAMGTALSICAFSLVRNAFTNPDVRINKADRTAGYLENFEEGEKYREHNLRKFLSEREPHIFDGITKVFTSSK